MKRLPFYYPPIVDSFSGCAGVIGVMMLEEAYKPLIFSNNYLITYDKSINAPGFNWEYYNDDYFIFSDMRKEVQREGLIDCIINTLELGFYVHIVLDHFYVKCSDFYRKKHMKHDYATIIGYDDVNKIFLVADNFKNGKYIIETLSFEEVNEVGKNSENCIVEKFQVVKNPQFNIDEKKLVCLLKSYYYGECYLSNKDINKNNKENFKGHKIIYGIRLYDILIEQVKNVKYNFYDIRVFHVMYNHMSLYLYLFDIFKKYQSEFIYEQCIEQVEKLINMSQIMQFSYLKLHTKWSDKLEKKVCDGLFNMKSCEKKLINSISKIILGVEF